MLEKALSGSKNYWTWVLSLLAVIGVGVIFFLQQFNTGLGITGMSRDVSWGLYVGQLTFFVGVAASAVMLVIPFYLHNFKKFGKLIILGEFLAVSAITMCLLFLFVDLGQPARAMNIFLHPTPNSIIFYDGIVLSGYLLLNIVIGWTTMNAEKKGSPPPAWLKPFIYLSIVWAFSIHTVTAFLYAGLPGREYWLTAIMAARFLASAFAAGPALLIILASVVRKVSKFDPGMDALRSLAKIVTYALIANLFFLGLEVFTAFYSGIPGEKNPFFYLYGGLDGYHKLVPVMWTGAILAVVALVLLIVPKTRNAEKTLLAAAGALFVALCIDKGLGLTVGGFVPNPFGRITEYWPTGAEAMITLGVWAIGALILTILYKVAIGVREENAGIEIDH